MNQVLNQIIEDYKFLYEREKEKRKELQQENEQLKKSIKLFTDDLANMTNKALLLKKQKDDVVDFIHKELDRFDCEESMSISMRISYFKEDLLRMLGEIDVED